MGVFQMSKTHQEKMELKVTAISCLVIGISLPITKETIMTSNLLSIIQQELKMDFDEIISEVGEAGNGTCTADQMEHHLWQQMLKLGGRLMQLFFEAG